MPSTPEDAVRISFRGSFMDATSGGNELDEFVFSLGGVVAHTNPITDWNAIVAELATDIRDSFEENWTGAVGGNTTATELLFPQTVRMNEVRVYHLNNVGTTEHLAAAAFESVRGAGAAPSLPPQCSLVVSLYAYAADQFNSMGRHGRGRFYLPALTSSLDVGGRLTGTVRDRVANWASAFLNDLEGKVITNGVTGDGALHLGILGNDGELQRIVRLRVGKIIDTQRRRRNRLDEEYVDRTIALD